MRTLFDRPLWRDPVLFVWYAFLAVVAVAALSGNTTWQGHLEAWRVAGFVQDFLNGALSSFLLLALLPAVIRRWWRSRRDGHRRSGPVASIPTDWRLAWANRGKDGLTGAPAASDTKDLDARWARLGVGRMGADWGSRSASSLTGQPTDRLPLRARLDSSPPRLLSVELTSAPDGADGFRVSWRTLNADSVSVGTTAGLPRHGSAAVERTEAETGVVVTAHGPGGTDSRVVALGVPTLALPQVTQVQMPPGPGIALTSSVRLGSHDDAPLVSTLEGVLRGHEVADTLRSVPTPFPGMRFLKRPGGTSALAGFGAQAHATTPSPTPVQEDR